MAGVNPARAGMIRGVGVDEDVGGGKPRASGDDPRDAESAYEAG